MFIECHDTNVSCFHFTDKSLDTTNRSFRRPDVPLDGSLPDRERDGIIPDAFRDVEGGNQKGGIKLVSKDGFTYVVNVSNLRSIGFKIIRILYLVDNCKSKHLNAKY